MHPLDKFKYCPSCGNSRFEENSEKSKLCKNCGFEYFLNPSSANVAFIVNAKGELLVERRKQNPGKGTLDLPGGFADINETAEEGVRREVKEETGLTVTKCTYLFSQPNVYLYSGMNFFSTIKPPKRPLMVTSPCTASCICHETTIKGHII